jgi:acid phosphatase type 7
VTAMARRLTAAVAIAAAVAPVSAGEAVADPVIAAAGDIACDPLDPGYNGGNGTSDRCRQRATSDLLVGGGIDAVLMLGDMQYDSPTAANLAAVYDPTWGRVKSITRPVLGNHEGAGTGYFNYFNGVGVADGPAGRRGRGYYSFDLGGWHLIALNSNCTRVSCGAGSIQERWLRADLAAHPAMCTLAFWHTPRYSSGHDGSHVTLHPFWKALSDAGAEVVLTAHSHNYERFAPLDANGKRTAAGGMRQFVVGTGGAFFTGLGSRLGASEVAQNNTFGVLKLTLHPTSYDWQFVPIAGGTFTDSGSGACHGQGAPPPPPPPPSPPVAAPDTTAPVITNLRMTRKHFKRRTKFRYGLSEAASVRFVIRRKTQVGRARVRYRKVGAFTQTGVPGHNGRRFRGRIGKRPLRSGVFKARVSARDAAGNRSSTAQVSFRIVR